MHKICIHPFNETNNYREIPYVIAEFIDTDYFLRFKASLLSGIDVIRKK